MNITFTDREENSVAYVIQAWENIIASQKLNESAEDPDIKEIVENKDSEYVTVDTTSGEAKLYSTGIKKNGKIDMCLVSDDNKQTFMYDCTLTESDENPYETNTTL